MERLQQHFWDVDVQQILRIRTSPRGREDFIAWFPEKSGQFTVKSAYKLATREHDDSFAGGASSMCPEGDRSIWNYVWRAKVPLKMRITAWKAESGARSTDQNKLYRHIWYY